MSASRERKQRNLAGLSEKEKKEAIEAAKHKRKVILYSILGGLGAIAIIALLVWDSGIVQRNLTAYTVGDHKYTAGDLDYYYFSQYNTYYNYYGSYLWEDGVAMRDQVLSTDEDGTEVTWRDYLLELAASQLTQETILTDDAAANGYELSEDGESDLESTISTLELYASYYGYTTEGYLKAMYGDYATEDGLRENMTRSALAEEYADYIQTGFSDAVTEDEINTYYADNSADYDSYTYRCYYVTGYNSSDELTDDEISAAMDSAKATAEELQADLQNDDADAVTALVDSEDVNVTAYYSGEDNTAQGLSLSTAYAEWLEDAARTEGEVGIVDSDYGYYVVVFEGRYLDEYKPASYEIVTITAETDEDADAPTEEQMAAAKVFAEEASNQDDLSTWAENTDADATYNSESSVTRTSVETDALESWLYDEDRAEGDTAIFENDAGTGYYVVRFTAYDDETYWMESIRSAIASDEYNDWYDGISEGVEYKEGAGYSLCGDN